MAFVFVMEFGHLIPLDKQPQGVVYGFCSIVIEAFPDHFVDLLQ